jgi:hypothetical protein
MMADREESWRRSALTTHHLCPSAGQRNHRHRPPDRLFGISAPGRRGGLSSGVRSASSPCVRR